jgi:hypothetical protein
MQLASCSGGESPSYPSHEATKSRIPCHSESASESPQDLHQDFLAAGEAEIVENGRCPKENIEQKQFRNGANRCSNSEKEAYRKPARASSAPEEAGSRNGNGKLPILLHSFDG